MFVRLLATLVTADAIDRAARKPPKYWYPGHAQPVSDQPQLVAIPAGPPAGWYPDPAGPAAWRWWDGQQWTIHTAQRSQAALEA